MFKNDKKIPQMIESIYLENKYLLYAIKTNKFKFKNNFLDFFLSYFKSRKNLIKNFSKKNYNELFEFNLAL